MQSRFKGQILTRRNGHLGFPRKIPMKGYVEKLITKQKIES